MKRKPYFLLVLLLIVVPAKSQKLWSLEECIYYAYENNIVIKQQSLKTEVNKNNLLQSRLDLLPSINASAGESFSFGRALDQTTYQFTDQQVTSTNANINSNVTLFRGFQKLNSIKENNFTLQQSLANLDELKNNIALNIASAYLQILFSGELLQVAKEQYDVTEQQVERTQKLVEAGSLPKGSLLEIQAQYSAEELRVIQAENQLNINYLNLTQMLDMDSVGNFRIVKPEFEDVSDQNILFTVDQIYTAALDVLPRIRASEYGLQATERSLAMARGGRSPQLSLNANYGTGYSDIRNRVVGSNTMEVPIGTDINGNPVMTTTNVPIFGNYPLSDQFRDNASTTISINLSIPILNGWMVNNAISNSKINVLNSRYELINTKKNLYKEIQQAYADAIAAQKQYRASQKTLAFREESFKYTEQKFEVGLVNTVDYNVAKNLLAQTNSDLLQAKYDFIFKMKILDFYRGESIKLK